SGRASSDHAEIDAFSEFHPLGMNSQNFLASFDVRKVYGDLPIKTSRPKQRRIEDIGPVCRCDNDNPFLCVKSVHLNEQSVQRLLALIVPATESMTTVPSKGIDLINKNNAGCGFFSQLKHVTHDCGANTDNHFYKIRAADTEKRYI